MLRTIVRAIIRTATEIMVGFSTPFSWQRCKALLLGRESCFGWGMSKKGWGVALLLFAAGAEPVLAQEQCGRRDGIERALLQKYQESPILTGVTSNGGLVIVLATESGSTWSILVATPEGYACLVAAGENWRPVEPTAPGEDS